MAPCRRRAEVVCILFWFLIACHGVELCASINHEGFALLRFKEMIEDDPSDALSDWDEGATNPCSWFGVECSDDGRVVALNLENLGLKGMLSREIGNLIHMNYLILHNNSFYGIIPTEIGDLQALKVLDLGYNNFSGLIPSGLGNRMPLEFLFLKGNEFSGGVSTELHEFARLCEFQLHEDLTWSNGVSIRRKAGNATIRRLLATKHGRIPSGSTIEVIEVPKLPFRDPIGAPFQQPRHREATPPSSPPLPLPHTPPPPESLPSPPPISPITEQPTSQEHKSGTTLIIYTSVGAAICFVVVALLALYFLRYRHKKTSSVVPLCANASRQLQTATVGGVALYRWSELETASEGFSNIIGSFPGFTLYKGTLPCGAEIAIMSRSATYKSEWSSLAEAQFKKKVEVWSKVNHKNLMNLVGYCEDKEPFARMMVFEYVPNGSLFEHLHFKESEHLNWQSRLRVAVGVIYCLDYLHQQDPPVVLRNLNSSCIYLTEDNAAKISNIRLCSDKEDEGFDYDSFDEDSAVYDFGLLLLEITSGRRAYSDDNGLLVIWASSYLTGNRPLTSMIDPTLKSVPEEHVSAICELIRSCISQDPMARPTMSEVAKRMQQITGISRDHAVPRINPLWWAELEIITS